MFVEAVDCLEEQVLEMVPDQLNCWYPLPSWPEML